GFVAQTDNRRDAHLGGAREADDRHADAARLRGERGVALEVVGRAEGGAEILPGVVKAVDVRPHEADIVAPADLLDLALTLDVAGLGEARGNEHGAGNLLLAAFDERLRHELGGNGEDGDVDVAGDILYRLIGLAPHDLVGLGMDRIDLSLIAAVDEVLHHG